MIQTCQSKTWKQYIPSNLSSDQLKYWHTTGIHYEAQYLENHFDIEKFPHKVELAKILNTAWAKEIKAGKIVVSNTGNRIRYTFKDWKEYNNHNEIIVENIENEYNVSFWVDLCLKSHKTVATPTATVKQRKSSDRFARNTPTKNILPFGEFVDKLKSHYGKKYTNAIYSKERHYSNNHNGLCTWEDPNYKEYENNLKLLNTIQDINRPVRKYIETNMKNIWNQYRNDCKKEFDKKTQLTQMDYAKYCSDYIQNLIKKNKLPQIVIRKWKHWSKLK